MPGLRRAVAVFLLGLAQFAPSAAFAEDEDANTAEARRLYGDAKKAMSDKKYREAALSFEAASKLKANAVSLYTAAQAWELAGEPARAADAYARALSTPKLNEAQTKRSQERLDALEKELGTLAVSGSETTRVQLDDHIELTAPARFHGLSGEHSLTIWRADGKTEKRKVTLEVATVTEVDAEKAAEEPDLGPEPAKRRPVPLAESRKVAVEPEKPASGTWKTVGLVSLGAGVAALGGTVLLGMSAKDAEETYKASPTRETFDHAKSLETRTNILLITGGVLTAAGAGLLIWQALKKPERPAPQTASLQVRIAPSAVWAEGRF